MMALGSMLRELHKSRKSISNSLDTFQIQVLPFWIVKMEALAKCVREKNEPFLIGQQSGCEKKRYKMDSRQKKENVMKKSSRSLVVNEIKFTSQVTCHAIQYWKLNF